MAGKGDKRRPIDTDADTFAANWDRIFNKPNEEPSNETKEKDTKETNSET